MDIYAEITNRIVSEMESGLIPWAKPWVALGGCVSYATGNPYSLLNQMLLGRPDEYATYKQIQSAGGYVKKGQKASMVVFWKWIEQEDKDGEKKEIPFLRYYNVFHIDQCEGLKAKHSTEFPQTANADQKAESIICDYLKTSGVKLNHEQGDRAFYRPSDDSITLPLLAQFKETAEYYSTAFHEMIHSTGHMSRLNRLEKTAFFGTEAYSKEELIAEIGAAALVNASGLETTKSFRNNAAYIQNWLSVLKNDKRFIVSAAGKAEKAVNLILGTAA
ncbi:MAG: zincin-like metallopeptidase domain-containing protein [Christensenellales bacterium]|nr:zincin-like metallopeptidase domain-containing protein [Christensenellales bacterium]